MLNQLSQHEIKALIARVVICCVVAVVFAGAVIAQTTPGHSKREEERFPEVEALVSNEFRNLNFVAPILLNLNFEGHYFGIRTHPESQEHRSRIEDLAIIAGSYDIRLGKHVTLSPGLGVYFGEGQRTSPAFTIRWEVEKGRFFSQGLFIQSLLESEQFGHPNIWDGNHVSVRFWRLELGPSWERIHTREENEWKGGGRAAVKIISNFSLVFFVLGPRTEFRAGILIHPVRRD